MGLMSLIFGGGNTQPATSGAHQIDKSKVLRPTDGQAFSPHNPGEFESLRSVPVCKAPRYFNREEASALRLMAEEKTSAAKATKRAYKSLRKIDDADTVVHGAHYRYARRVAGNEVQKLQSTQTYARRLHGLRPQYAALAAGLEQAEKQAAVSISAIKEGLVR
jgi:hypothetical protein